jgi:hypothetical protein
MGRIGAVLYRFTKGERGRMGVVIILRNDGLDTFYIHHTHLVAEQHRERERERDRERERESRMFNNAMTLTCKIPPSLLQIQNLHIPPPLLPPLSKPLPSSSPSSVPRSSCTKFSQIMMRR